MPKTSSGHALLNGTEFDYVVSSAPRAYANPRKLHQQNKTEYTVRRVVVVQLKVKAKHKSPEGITFVPLFLTTDDQFLDPGTCDPVGKLECDRVQLHAGFIDKVESRDVKLKGKKVTFEMDDEVNLLDDIDLPPPMPPMPHQPPTSAPRKFAAKTFPPFFGMKRPRLDDPIEDSDDDKSEESDAEDEGAEAAENKDGTGTDVDSDGEVAEEEGDEVLRRPFGAKRPCFNLSS